LRFLEYNQGNWWNCKIIVRWSFWAEGEESRYVWDPSLRSGWQKDGDSSGSAPRM